MDSQLVTASIAGACLLLGGFVTSAYSEISGHNSHRREDGQARRNACRELIACVLILDRIERQETASAPELVAAKTAAGVRAAEAYAFICLEVPDLTDTARKLYELTFSSQPNDEAIREATVRRLIMDAPKRIRPPVFPSLRGLRRGSRK